VASTSTRRTIGDNDGVTVMLALVRGVNVGGKKKLAMADLRQIAEECGFEEVRTYIQSGNAVFRVKGMRTGTVAERLRAGIADRAGLAVDVVVRTRDELAAVVDDNPYVARGEDPAHLHAVFLIEPASDPLGALDLDAYSPEEASAAGSHVYLFLPNGMGRSKLAVDLGRLEQARGTARNWRTVTTLLDMADDLA
jgi:uncharacterized protein (DUF1697 family)